ncbi:MAG: GtrA family protein [Candidatus Paracaedibacteraceae bacterium]|nr:GtrA family protein [Candidatus Paracaedibacteraceae bacterium]
MQISPAFIRYLLVGAVNTVFGYSVFALLIFIGWHYSIALLFATVAGVIFNFQTFGKLVFKQSEWRLLWKFVAVYGVLYAVNVLLVFGFLYFMRNVYAANALAIIFIAGLGYFLNRRFVYENN